MSASPSYWTLTHAEDCALYSLGDDPFFDTEEVGICWRGRKAELDAARLTSYCDVLFAEMRKELMGMKGELLSALKAKIATATHPRELKVPIRSFFSTYEPRWPGGPHWEGSPNWNACVQHGREEYVRAQAILANGWDERIAVVRQEEWDDELDGCESCNGGDPDAGRRSWVLRPERTYTIATKTDLLQRLGTLFGPHYNVTLEKEWEGREVDGRYYSVFRNTFYLHYLPYEPPAHHKKALAMTLVKYAAGGDYTPFTLGPLDRVIGFRGETVLRTPEPS
jgi:hypothetical protein